MVKVLRQFDYRSVLHGLSLDVAVVRGYPSAITERILSISNGVTAITSTFS